MPYTLDEAASLLRLNPATLRYWEEALREELNIGRDSEGRLCFEESHLHALDQVRLWVLREKRSLEEVRRLLTEQRLLRRDRDELHAPGEPVDEARSVDRESSAPGAGTDHGTADTSGSALQAGQARGMRDDHGESPLERRVAELVDTVGYLVEENQALQELVGRLIHFVESLGEGVAASKTSTATGPRTDNGDEASRNGGPSHDKRHVNGKALDGGAAVHAPTGEPANGAVKPKLTPHSPRTPLTPAGEIDPPSTPAKQMARSRNEERATTATPATTSKTSDTATNAAKEGRGLIGREERERLHPPEKTAVLSPADRPQRTLRPWKPRQLDPSEYAGIVHRASLGSRYTRPMTPSPGTIIRAASLSRIDR